MTTAKAAVVQELRPGTVAGSHRPTAPLPDALRAGLDEKVREVMARLHVPGAAVGVWHQGREYVAGYGVTSVENPLPVTADTLFQAGSISKTVTATTIMRLVERGDLDLLAPVRTYLPDLRLRDEDAAARVTLRHLLTHTGGWAGDFFEDFGFGDDAVARYVAAMVDLPQLTPAGEVWHYNNAGFSLAARVVEVVTGTPFEDVVQALVLDPLGMQDTFYRPVDVMTRRFSVGHHVHGDRVEVLRPWHIPRSIAGAGGVVTTPGDLLRYARFHLSDGAAALAADGERARLLSPETMAQMQTPIVAADRSGRHFGLGWSINNRGAAPVQTVSHDGATHGQIASLVLVPGHDFAIAAFANARGSGTLTAEVVTWALEHVLGIVDPEAVHLDVPQSGLAEYAGTYRGALTTADVELSVRDGALTAQVQPKGGFPTRDTPPPPPPPPTRLAVVAEETLLALDPPLKGTRYEIMRNQDGAIVWLRAGGRILTREARS